MATAYDTLNTQEIGPFQKIYVDLIPYVQKILNRDKSIPLLEKSTTLGLEETCRRFLKGESYVIKNHPYIALLPNNSLDGFIAQYFQSNFLRFGGKDWH